LKSSTTFIFRVQFTFLLQYKTRCYFITKRVCYFNTNIGYPNTNVCYSYLLPPIQTSCYFITTLHHACYFITKQFLTPTYTSFLLHYKHKLIHCTCYLNTTLHHACYFNTNMLLLQYNITPRLLLHYKISTLDALVTSIQAISYLKNRVPGSISHFSQQPLHQS
jgi:hypothetical protein